MRCRPAHTHDRSVPIESISIAALIALLSLVPSCRQALGDRCDDELLCERGLECRDGRCVVASPPDPLDGIEVDETLVAECLDAPVDILIDEWNTPHVYASSLEDGWAAIGFLMARDRFAQLELTRRAASGTLAEVTGEGELADLLVRLLGLRRAAEESWDLIPPEDPDARALIGFSRGVNAFIERARSGDEPIPEELRELLDQVEEEWTPVDSLAVARLDTLRRTWNADDELMLHLLLQQSQQVFTQDASDPDLARRAGFADDVARLAPIRDILTPHGPAQGSAETLPGVPPRPRLDPETAAGWHRALRALRVRAPADRSSLAWAGSSQTGQSGGALLSAVLGGPLSAPPPYAAIHLSVDDGGDAPFEAAGLVPAGVPAIVAGFNRRVAWVAMPSGADLLDLYLEEIVEIDGETLAAVRDEGDPVELEPVELAAGGTTLSTAIVPGVGPLVPSLTDGQLSRGWDEVGLSLRWAGRDPRRDLAALSALAASGSVDDARAALSRWPLGDLRVLVAEADGEAASFIPWCLPGRDPRVLQLHWLRPDRSPPSVVGSGPAIRAWTGCSDAALGSRWAVTTGESVEVLLATGADPTGATLMNEPFHHASPYLGWSFAPGLREARLEELLGAPRLSTRPSPVEAAALLTDGRATLFEAALPLLRTAMERARDHRDEREDAPDLDLLIRQLEDRFERLERGFELLDDWDLSFPAGTEAEVGHGPARSAAAALAGAWLLRLYDNVVADELEHLGVELHPELATRILSRLLSTDRTLRTYSRSLDQSHIFDDLRTGSHRETRDERLLRSLDEAIEGLEEELGPDMNEWRWGEVHRATLRRVAPAGGELETPGLAGGPWSVRGCGPELAADDLGCHGSGPMARLAVELAPWGPRALVVLAGGGDGDEESETGVTELDLWAAGETRPLAFSLERVVEVLHRRVRMMTEGTGDR